MEYASGGELFDRIVKANRFSEDEARYFFQQLISGVAWCHKEVRAAAAIGPTNTAAVPCLNLNLAMAVTASHGATEVAAAAAAVPEAATLAGGVEAAAAGVAEQG